MLYCTHTKKISQTQKKLNGPLDIWTILVIIRERKQTVLSKVSTRIAGDRMKKISAENLIWMLGVDPTSSLSDLTEGNK